jgi:hypothetical protein
MIHGFSLVGMHGLQVLKSIISYSNIVYKNFEQNRCASLAACYIIYSAPDIAGSGRNVLIRCLAAAYSVRQRATQDAHLGGFAMPGVAFMISSRRPIDSFSSIYG